MRSRGHRIGAVLALVAVGAAVIRGRLRRYEIAEASMQPTLLPGDYVLAASSDGAPRRGEIVILSRPGQPDFELVKRIVGLPGEQLIVANGQVNIDGSPLAEPWAEGPTFPDGEWLLGNGEVFVLGDQRSRSSGDGRELGPLPIDAARWRVIARYWPPRRIGLLR